MHLFWLLAYWWHVIFWSVLAEYCIELTMHPCSDRFMSLPPPPPITSPMLPSACSTALRLEAWCRVGGLRATQALFSQQSCELVCCLHEASLGSARGARAPMSLGDVDGETAEEAVVDGLNEPAARSRSASPVPRPSRRAQSQPCVKRDLRSRTPAARRGRGR